MIESITPFDRGDPGVALPEILTGGGLTAAIAGLYLAAGTVGVALGVGIVLATIATTRPLAFALGQAGVVGIVPPVNGLFPLALVEGGLVLMLLATLPRKQDDRVSLALAAGTALGFLGFVQIARGAFDSIPAGAVALVCACGVVLGLITYVGQSRVAKHREVGE
jgi:energy-converting hydrogenase Eha subunit C